MHTPPSPSVTDCSLCSNAARCTATSCAAAFEESTGSTWPLNIGQVYPPSPDWNAMDSCGPCRESEAGQRPYEITDAGRPI